MHFSYRLFSYLLLLSYYTIVGAADVKAAEILLDDPAETALTNLITVCNFSYHPCKDAFTADAILSVPLYTRKGLLYISTPDTTLNHEAIARSFVESAKNNSILSIMLAMQEVIQKHQDIYMAFLLPGFLLYGRYSFPKMEHTIERVAPEREIVTLGKGERRAEIAYKKWLKDVDGQFGKARMIRFQIDAAVKLSQRTINLEPSWYLPEGCIDVRDAKLMTNPTIVITTSNLNKIKTTITHFKKELKRQPVDYRSILILLRCALKNNPCIGSMSFTYNEDDIEKSDAVCVKAYREQSLIILQPPSSVWNYAGIQKKNKDPIVLKEYEKLKKSLNLQTSAVSVFTQI